MRRREDGRREKDTDPHREAGTPWPQWHPGAQVWRRLASQLAVRSPAVHGGILFRSGAPEPCVCRQLRQPRGLPVCVTPSAPSSSWMTSVWGTGSGPRPQGNAVLSFIYPETGSGGTVCPGCLPHCEPLDLSLRTGCLPLGPSEAPRGTLPGAQGPALSPTPQVSSA